MKDTLLNVYEVTVPETYVWTHNDVQNITYRISLSIHTYYRSVVWEVQFGSDRLTGAPYYKSASLNTSRVLPDEDIPYESTLILFLTLLKRGALLIPEDAWISFTMRDMKALKIGDFIMLFTKPMTDFFSEKDTHFGFSVEGGDMGRIPWGSFEFWHMQTTFFGEKSYIPLNRDTQYNYRLKSTELLREIIQRYLVPIYHVNARVHIME